MRKYLPDFIVRVDDGRPDLLNLVVEVKGYRGEDAKEKKATMDTYWIPGVNNLGTHGRWAFVELKDAFAMQDEFAARILDYTEIHGEGTEGHGEKNKNIKNSVNLRVPSSVRISLWNFESQIPLLTALPN
jgi:hypothetical protein